MIEQIKTQYGGNVAKARQAMKMESRKFPKHLIEIPVPPHRKAVLRGLTRAFRSRDFLVMEVQIEGVTRLTINRADIDGEGKWKDGITWEEIQRLKREAGYGDKFAVECYPEDEHIVNDANMRHIFILNERPTFAWTSANRAKKP